MAEQQQTTISKTVIKLVATVVFMLFFVPFVMVPLYNVLCEQLGINGKTGGRYRGFDIFSEVIAAPKAQQQDAPDQNQ